MGGPFGGDSADRRQARLFRWMTAVSVVVHTATLFLCTSVASLYPSHRPPPVVIVELEDAPMPTPTVPEVKTVSLETAGETPAASEAKPAAPAAAAPRKSAARTWLKRMDAGLAGLADAPARSATARAGMPARRVEADREPAPGDVSPAAAPERGALSGQVSGLEEKIRRSGGPGVGAAGKTDFVAMFGEGGGSGAEAVPAWLRAMIRKKMLEYLPELEAAYSRAWRRNPGLKGRMTLRFRIGPAGTILDAGPGDTSLRDLEFVAAVVERVRGWRFDSTAGRTVEVTYPLVFLEPSS